MSDQDETAPSEGKAVQPFTPQESHVMLERTGVNPAMWRMMTELAKQCIASGAFPAALTNPAKALVVMQAGVELGMKPMQAVQSMFFINGKLAMYSSALLAMMKKNGLVVKWKILTAEKVVGEFSTPNQPAVEISFGKEDATRAGLSGGNYTKYPQDMFVARCVSRAAKLFPDLIGAPIETTEVMDDVVVAQAQEETAPALPVPTKLQTNNEKKEVKKQERKTAAAVPPDEMAAQYMADPVIAEIIDELKCAETDDDFEGVREMIVSKPWSVDKARYLGDKFVFFKDALKNKGQPVGVEAAQEVFGDTPAAPAPSIKKTRSERMAELQAMKSVDLKPILSGYDIDFTGMDKEARIGTILAWEFPNEIPQPSAPSNPPVASPVQTQAPTPPSRPGVLGKLFDAA